MKKFTLHISRVMRGEKQSITIRGVVKTGHIHKGDKLYIKLHPADILICDNILNKAGEETDKYQENDYITIVVSGNYPYNLYSCIGSTLHNKT